MLSFCRKISTELQLNDDNNADLFPITFPRRLCKNCAIVLQPELTRRLSGKLEVNRGSLGISMRLSININLFRYERAARPAHGMDSHGQ